MDYLQKELDAIAAEAKRKTALAKQYAGQVTAAWKIADAMTAHGHTITPVVSYHWDHLSTWLQVDSSLDRAMAALDAAGYQVAAEPNKDSKDGDYQDSPIIGTGVVLTVWSACLAAQKVDIRSQRLAA